MKLLPLSAQKEQQADSLRLTILRTEEAREEWKKWNSKMEEAKEIYENNMKFHREEADKQIAKVKEEIAIVNSELERIKEETRKAMEPVEDMKRQEKIKLNEASLILERAKVKEEENEETANTLQDKLDEVGEREMNVRIQEERIQAQLEGIETQKIIIRNINEQLNEGIKNSIAEMESKQKELEERDNKLKLEEINIETKDNLLKEKEESLSEWSIKLQDERNVLDQNWKELARKKLK